MSEKEISETKRSIISEGFIIAFIPIAAYVIAFIYEHGYTSYFGIPWELINISLTNVLILAAALLFISLFLFQIIVLINTMLSLWNNVLIRWLKNHLMLFMSFLILIIIARDWKLTCFLLAFLFLIFIIPDIILPIFPWDKSTYFQRLCALEKKELEEKKKKSITLDLAEYLGRETILFYILFCFIAISAHALGGVNAQKQGSFFILKEPSEKVVLRIYGDNLICNTFTRGTNILKRELLIKKIGSDTEMLLQYEKVGPFKLENR